MLLSHREGVEMITGYDEKYNVVVKSNDLITKSRFSLSLQQQRIILFMISKINPFDEDFSELEFDIKDFCRACCIDGQNGQYYITLKEHIKSISDKSIWIKLADGRETLLRWIEKPYIDEKNGTIRLRMDRDMKPFLLDLKKNFTEYELIFTLYFKSKYSIRLYEYIRAVFGNHKREKAEIILSLDDFKSRVDAETYTEFFNLNNRVLKPTVKEINQHSDMCLDYELLKHGKKVSAVKFIISHKTSDEVLKLYQAIEDKEHKGQQTFFGV